MQRRLLLLGLPAFLVGGFSFFIVVALPWLLTHQPRPAPDHPIAFNHAVHVDQLGLDCAFCHRTAAVSQTAGMPDVEQCMFCHQVVTEGRHLQATGEIRRIVQMWNEQRTVEWQRVHRMPDHTLFVHDAHIRAGVTCATCHGDVQRMTQVVQVRPLTMRDCVDCHRENSAPTDCAVCHH